MDLTRPWQEYSLVVFDTETSGGYPVGSEIVEFGALKIQAGQIVDEMQVLIKPREPMSDFIIGIHGITNEMVESAPPMREVAPRIKSFLQGSVGVAHHAPFDLGFICYELEKNRMTFPVEPNLCTSLLARRLITGVPNHKLQTLVQHFRIQVASAHRALDDARACWVIAQRCFEVAGPRTLQELIKLQGTPLRWKDFSLLAEPDPIVQTLVKSIENRGTIEMIYKKGQTKNTPRRARPLGIVRNPEGDYLMAYCLVSFENKRFYLKAIADVQEVM